MQKQIVDYKVVLVPTEVSPLEDSEMIAQPIKEAINEGWQPQGGLCVSDSFARGRMLAQALVKYKE